MRECSVKRGEIIKTVCIEKLAGVRGKWEALKFSLRRKFSVISIYFLPECSYIKRKTLFLLLSSRFVVSGLMICIVIL